METRLIIHILVICMVESQNLPSYWSGTTTTNFNGTMADSVPMTIVSSDRKFMQFDSVEDKEYVRLLKAGHEMSLNESLPSNLPPANKSGKYYHAHYVKGYITDLEVLDEYNFDGNNTVPVRLSTSWQKELLHDNGNDTDQHFTPGDMAVAMKKGHILNITIKMAWREFTKNIIEAINKDRLWEIEEYLCYYQGTATRMIKGKCYIPYSDIIDHYYRLWTAEPFQNELVNGHRIRVTNEPKQVKEPPCFKDVYGEMDTYDPYCETPEPIILINDTEVILTKEFVWYMFESVPMASGYSVNTTYGYNRTVNSYDFNFTVLFNNWTIDFPSGLVFNYRDGSFEFEQFELEIYFWVEDPPVLPERPVPSEVFFMLITVGFAIFILLAAITVRLLTRSGYSFSLVFWDYWKRLQKNRSPEMTGEEKQEARNKQALEDAEEAMRQHVLGVL